MPTNPITMVQSDAWESTAALLDVDVGEAPKTVLDEPKVPTFVPTWVFVVPCQNCFGSALGSILATLQSALISVDTPPLNSAWTVALLGHCR